MLVKTLKDATITVKAGQTVDVKDDEAVRACALGFAVPVLSQAEKPAKKTTKKAAK